MGLYAPYAAAVLAMPAFGGTSPSADAKPEASALDALNAFLSESAETTPIYREDLQRGGDPGPVANGRLAGFSPLIGPFTYRPKTFAELTRAERLELLRDGRFHAFLLNRSRHFALAPEDLLRPQPLLIRLDPP